MNSETHITDELAAYALNILDADEAAAVAAHLATCPVCRQELQTYQELVGLMATAVPSVAPPPTLKQQLMEDVRKEKPVDTAVSSKRPPASPPAPPKTNWWSTLRDWFQQRPILQPVLLLLVAVLLVSNFQLRQRLAEADRPAGFGTVTLTSTEAAEPGTGILIISADGMHGTLVVQDLPMLPETQTYQLWLIKDGHPTSGGVFNVNEDGYRAIWVGSVDPLASYTDFDLTLEPADGSAYPTGRSVLNN